MTAKQPNTLSASCRCGSVVLEMTGAPIVHTVCYCSSCQEAGERIERLAGVAKVLDPDGGTDFLLYRKDRVRCAKGGELLQARRLKPDSATRRMIASCCNSAMFLDFNKGHWLSFYRGRLPQDVPPLQMRVMTADRRSDVTLPGDVPNYKAHSGRFMGKLLAAWIAMGFRAPKLADVAE